jgi:heme exporter protein C
VNKRVDRKRLTFLAVAVGGLLTTIAFVMAFAFSAPVLSNNTLETGGGAIIGGKLIENPVLFSQKIFYFHVPVAITSFVIFFFTAFYGVRFLMTKEKRYDTMARIATEVTLVFVALTMITGDLWTRYEWGQWWVWEPRLTTYFIMMMLVIVYFVLRASIEDEERRAVYASAFGILAFLDAPLSFAITRIVPATGQNHPVVLRAGGGLDAIQLSGFIIGLVGMLCLGYAIYQLRLREETAKERLEALKASLEG